MKTKSMEPQLYGVRHPNMTNNDGTMISYHWAELRAPDAWGQMNDGGARIIWFNDPGVRDEFKKHFGGVGVTLTRKSEEFLTGSKASDFLKEANKGKA